jgi:uncharacterized protein DUF3293
VKLPPELHAAYLRTTYWVEARPAPIALRVGERSRVLDRLLAKHRVRVWAFVTAWNPKSQRLASWRNVARDARLRHALAKAGYRWLPALGEGDDPAWTPEPSMLVFGMSVPHAVRLGRLLKQNAVVIGKLGGRATLLWCGPARR